MTNPFVALQGVTCVLADGRTLFSNLHEVLDHRPTGLVGRNGVGKSMLARILSGEREPTQGRCVRSGRVHYLEQLQAFGATDCVATAAGQIEALDALERIESGHGLAPDFERVDGRWDLRERLQAELSRAGLRDIDLRTPALQLSGGEAMRVALAGAFLSGADFLILDEPTNHLDRNGRAALAAQLQHWKGGLLVISHDRLLLAGLSRILELTSNGLQSYGGNYDFYATQSQAQRKAAEQQLESLRHERRQTQRALRAQQQRAEQHQARGRREGKLANEPPILLGTLRGRAEKTIGRLNAQHAAGREEMDARVREAAAKLADAADVSVHAVAAGSSARQPLRLVDVQLPHLAPPLDRIDLTLTAGQRLAVLGPNGCGKSVLTRVMAGELAPLRGRCEHGVPVARLDQRLANLARDASVREQMLHANPLAGEAQLRMQLQQLDLDAARITLPAGQLSGGERLKTALALVLYGRTPAQLLLLDEPANHLDLPSLRALESMLREYVGTLVVVSHDDAFLDALDLSHRLLATPEGWRLEPW